MAITDVTGTIADGQSITVTGTGFGSGCADTYFESFAAITSNDEVITTSNTNFDGASGLWPAKSRTDSRSGTYSMRGWGAKTSDATDFRASTVSFQWGPTQETEAFVCFAVKIPTGKRMPGNTTGNNVYPSDSAWKASWLMDDISTDDDVCCPTLVALKWSIGGNDLGLIKEGLPHNTNNWFVQGEWVRMSTWLRAGDVPETDLGDYYFEGMCPSGTTYTVSGTDPLFSSGTAPYGWTRVNLPGWMRERDSDTYSYADDIEPLYDDIYFARGANAAARIEIGDNSVYNDCTKRAICEYSSWSGTSISGTVREGDLNLSGGLWLFVVDSDNTIVDSFEVTESGTTSYETPTSTATGTASCTPTFIASITSYKTLTPISVGTSSLVTKLTTSKLFASSGTGTSSLVTNFIEYVAGISKKMQIIAAAIKLGL